MGFKQPENPILPPEIKGFLETETIRIDTGRGDHWDAPLITILRTKRLTVSEGTMIDALLHEAERKTENG